MTVVLPDRYLTLIPGTRTEDDVSQLVKDITRSEIPVSVTQLKGGITNQLFLVEQDGLKVLVRSFGKGTDTFIDRPREFAVHSCLQKLGLAPKLYCQFANGLVYGYVPGRPTCAEELNNKYIMEQVSHRLAQWHATLNPADVAEFLEPRRLDNFWDVLEHWVHICPEGVLSLSTMELRQEFIELKKQLIDLGGSEVMGHCDLLSANILVPTQDSENTYSTSDLSAVPLGTDPNCHNIVKSDAAFIDYEYSIPCPRAFDIANHFQEWQGFECEKDRVPQPDESSPELRFWCEEYLRAYEALTGTKRPLSVLIKELRAFWGMPGFYWGVWSAIQSQCSSIDFGYHAYAQNRFQEYLDWKRSWEAVKP